MNKYIGFSDRYNGPVKFLTQDLGATRCFVIKENRVAVYDKGHLNYENGDRTKAFKVWSGVWPKDNHVVDDVIKVIEKSRPRPQHDRK